jgi:Protein of unknown function (DUF742)
MRPYPVRPGPTRAAHVRFDVISLVTSVCTAPPAGPGLRPEQLAIVRLCQRAQSVAEISAALSLPLGVVRLLLRDLLRRRLIQVREPRPVTVLPDNTIFERLIDGLRAL